MKLFKHFQLALVIILLTDIATFDYKRFKSKKLTEGTCPRKKCILEKCAAGVNEPSTCQKIDCPIRLASCGVKEKPCGACAKEKSSCPQKEPNVCPFCGQEICPQQQQPKSNCPQEKPSGCPNQQPSCPHQKPSCQSQKQKPQPKPSTPAHKPGCPQSKPKCPQSAPTKCPQQPKPSCPVEKPACPERCSLFRMFSFPSITTAKKSEVTKEEDKTKCPGAKSYKGKPVK